MERHLEEKNRKRTIKTTGLETNVEVPGDNFYPMEENVKEVNNAACLHSYIKELKEQDQQLLKWFYFENLKQADIAQKIDNTSDYVKQRIHRIRAKLKLKLSSDPDFTF